LSKINIFFTITGFRHFVSFFVKNEIRWSLMVMTLVQVHATKKSKKGDEERSEEFSRVYELPTERDVDPSKVTSSIYQDGVLTIELPVADALGQHAQPAQQ